MATLLTAEVERVAALSNDELANFRGVACAACGSRDCQIPLCDRGCERHAVNPIELPSGATRIVCTKCCETVECSNGHRVPRWQTTVLESDRFCATCCHIEPGELW